jgi:hypothetical protein
LNHQDEHDSRTRVQKLVEQLSRLATSIEACEALGVDGVLAEQVDVSFVEDPLDYIAYDLAQALTAADSEDGSTSDVPPLLATLVAEFKLCRALHGRVDETEVVRRTLDNLREVE